MNKIILKLTSLIFLAGCSARHDAGSSGPSGGVNEKPGVISFQEVKAAVFESKCLKCHVQYQNYENTYVEREQIKLSVESGRMPKNGTLTNEQRTLLLTWLDIGAPQFKDNNTPPPEDEGLLPTWASLSKKVFFPKCVTCHSETGQASFLDLSSRQVIFNARDRLFAGNKKLIDISQPENSYLIDVITDLEEPMPPVWSNLEALNEEEVQTIKDWIQLGLP